MSRLLRPACIDDQRELLDLLSEAVGEITGGGTLVDAVLGNDESGYFDLVASNGDGEGILFFINFTGDEAEYLRLLKCMQWYRENRKTIYKLYAGMIALRPAPTVFVVSPGYSCSMLKVLLNVRDGRIVLLKYVCFRDENGERSLFIEKMGDSDEDMVKVQRPFAPSLTDGRTGTAPETIAGIAEFRRQAGTDISKVSDEELHDLLE